MQRKYLTTALARGTLFIGRRSVPNPSRPLSSLLAGAIPARVQGLLPGFLLSSFLRKGVLPKIRDSKEDYRTTVPMHVERSSFAGTIGTHPVLADGLSGIPPLQHKITSTDYCAAIERKAQVEM